MISFYSISTFQAHLSALLKVKKGVYSSISSEISKEFTSKPIEQIRSNRDMILIEADSIIIKLRLPDKRMRLSKSDGYRLIYLVSKEDDVVVFLDIYPKNGPMQKLDLSEGELKQLLKEFITEATGGFLKPYSL